MPDPHFAYCATLKDKVSVLKLQVAVGRKVSGLTDDEETWSDECVFCRCNPMTDTWPPGMFILVGGVVCLHCAERHGT